MTTAAFHQLMETGSILLIAVLALGLLFERVGAGPPRDAVVGLLCGAFAALTVPFATPVADAPLDGRVPLVLLAGILGGPLAATLAVPLPVLSGLLGGAVPPLAWALSILIGASLGAGVRALGDALRIPPGRRTVACVALLSPATLAAHAIPGLSAGAAALAPLAVWTALATLAGGILAANELSRGDMLRDVRRAARFRHRTGHVAADVLDAHLAHYWNLHERDGVDYAFLVVSIDDAGAMRERLGAARWERVFERAGAALRRSLRATDTCAPIDFDRFGVLLPHATLTLALPIAERVRNNLSRAGISVSVGVSDAASTAGLCDVRASAEAALYAALAEEAAGAIGPSPGAHPRPAIRSFPGATADDRGGFGSKERRRTGRPPSGDDARDVHVAA